MAGRPIDTEQDRAEAIRRALIEAALAAYEDAGLSGVCEDGRWEAAVGAMRSFDLARARAALGDQRAPVINPTISDPSES